MIKRYRNVLLIIGSRSPGVKWSRDRWRHVTSKGQGRDPVILKAPYLRRSTGIGSVTVKLFCRPQKCAKIQPLHHPRPAGRLGDRLAIGCMTHADAAAAAAPFPSSGLTLHGQVSLLVIPVIAFAPGPDLACWRPGAQWRIWDFRKGGGNPSHPPLLFPSSWGVWWEAPCWW